MVSIGRWSFKLLDILKFSFLDDPGLLHQCWYVYTSNQVLKRNGAIHFLKSYRKKMNKPGYKMIKLFDFPFMLQETTKNLHLSKEHADIIYPLSSVINPSPPPPLFFCLLFFVFRR